MPVSELEKKPEKMISSTINPPAAMNIHDDWMRSFTVRNINFEFKINISGFFKNDLRLMAVFPGTVKGLHVGSPVLFRGVKIGLVVKIKLHLFAKR